MLNPSIILKIVLVLKMSFVIVLKIVENTKNRLKKGLKIPNLSKILKIVWRIVLKMSPVIVPKIVENPPENVVCDRPENRENRQKKVPEIP
ncbi:Hypothetical protein NTJ_03944 [Nesidiocoris tenuis]|uniref:Uncharacterized protein n=1 Tax=Nesidiocoris tenuis TaxID=355587 RepID=A0ABN7AFT1_9HEMI|nr:Hypothetical protein NTJ_03944 [Nesidiocoris tenuis]